MKKNIFYILFFLLFIFTNAQAQEGNNWFISDNIGVNFNCTPPTVSQILQPADVEKYAGEPCTSMSDTAGNLLFYTTCRSIYNRHNKIMLHGKDSLQQFLGYVFFNSIYSMPDPGNINRYYVFFIDLYDNKLWDPFDLNYAIVDMSLDNGMGDVVGIKRHIIKNVKCLAATKHKNKLDFWLAIVQNSGIGAYPIDSFVIFQVSASGLKYHKISVNTSILADGHIYFSPDGNRMAVFTQVTSPTTFFKIYDFNKENGMVSHPLQIKMPEYLSLLAFSPDNSKIYTYSSYNKSAYVYQYDISTGHDSNSIAKSKTMLWQGISDWGDLRLASDGKIYAIDAEKFYLRTIEKPNEAGINCQLMDDHISFNVPRNDPLNTYLPHFVTRHPEIMPYDISSFCANTPILFTPFKNVYSKKYHWDFGDPASGKADTSTQRIATHTYKNTGRYRVTLIADNYDSIIDTFSRFVCISPSPKYVAMDTNVCNGAQVKLDAGNPGLKYRWNDGDTTQTKTVKPGIWWVEVSNGSCTITDTAHIVDVSTSSINLGKDTTIRLGLSLTLRSGYATTKWSTGQTGDSIVVTTTGKYWATLKASGCQVTDTIVVKTKKSGIENALDLSSDLALKLIPNPASETTIVKFNTSSVSPYTFTITDISGKEIIRQTMMAQLGENSLKIDVRNFKPGTYIFNLDINGAIGQVKFLKE